MRSRAVSRPLACCRAMALSPPPARIIASVRASAASNSSSSVAMIPQRMKVLLPSPGVPGVPGEGSKTREQRTKNVGQGTMYFVCRPSALKTKGFRTPRPEFSPGNVIRTSFVAVSVRCWASRLGFFLAGVPNRGGSVHPCTSEEKTIRTESQAVNGKSGLFFQDDLAVGDIPGTPPDACRRDSAPAKTRCQCPRRHPGRYRLRASGFPGHPRVAGLGTIFAAFSGLSAHHRVS